MRNYRVIPESWLKKFLTVWIVPRDMQSPFLQRVLFLIRNIVFSGTKGILGLLNLLNYSEK